MENGCFWWWRAASVYIFIHCIFVWLLLFIEWELCLRFLFSQGVTVCVCVLCGIQHFFFLSFLHTLTDTIIFPTLFRTRARDFFPFSCDNVNCTTYFKIIYSFMHNTIFFIMRQIKLPISHIICNFFPYFFVALNNSKLHSECAKCV